MNRLLLLIILSVTTFMIILDYSVANVSIPYIAGALSVSVDQGTYVITSFAVGNAIGLALTGMLSQYFGQARIMIVSVFLFTLFSWTCGISWSLEVLVLNRFIQGLVAGPIIPLSQSFIVQYGTEETRAKDLSLWSNIIIGAPVVGPLLGGYLSEWHSWTWIFFINIPVGLICIAILWALFRGHESKRTPVKPSIWGIMLLVIGVSCLQIFLDKGQQWDWWRSDLIWILAVGTFIAFTFLGIQGLFGQNPTMPLRLFKIPSFALAVIALVISYGMYFGIVVVVPLWLQQYMGYTADWAGAAVCTLGIGPLFLSQLTPKMMNSWGNVPTFIGSAVFFMISCVYAFFFTTQVDFVHIALARFVFGLGFICYIAPLQSLCIEKVAALDLPNATGLFHFFRAIMAGVGTSIFTTIFARRTIFHHERVGSAVTRWLPDEGSLSLLNDALDRQAAMLAMNDLFWLMAWLFAALIVIMGIYLFITKMGVSYAHKTNN